MKFRLLSDLHTEFSTIQSRNFTYNQEDLLVLAGDIAVGSIAVAEVLRYFLNLGFPHIVYTPGNHDYWGTHIEKFQEELTLLMTPDTDRVTLLFGNTNTVKIKDVIIFGGTLWSNCDKGHPIVVSDIKRRINDFRKISNWTVLDMIRENQRQITNIKSLIENVEGKKLVVTHFLPARECVNEKYLGDQLNPYYANDYMNYLCDKDLMWVFGHSHDSCNMSMNDAVFISNPYGYDGYATNPQFNPNFTIEL